MTGPASLFWFGGHELRLAWRDWLSMMTAGRTSRARAVHLVVVSFVIGLHALAYLVLEPVLSGDFHVDRAVLTVVSGTLALSFFMMVSQALESVTRVFYSRSDLELILSSPAPASHVFALRIGAIVLSTVAMSALLAAPFVNVAVVLDDVRWLSAYLVLVGLAASATAIAVLIAAALFVIVGPKRTRFVAQVVAAVIGAGFLIGTQVAAILSFGNMSRYRLFSSDSIIAALPGAESMLWTPARAVMGDPAALGSMMALCVFLLGFVICTFAKRFGGWLIVAVNAEARDRDAIVPVRSFRDMTSGQALRAKEWRLLKRDPWLLSQSLMQILYLIPPAVLLFRNYGDGDNAFVLLAPILVMALGQLAGGLAWLAVSGEDAPDLVATAPVGAASMLRAKVEAVLAIIVAAASPFLVVVAFSAPFVALVTALGIAAAAGSAVAIQLWFQVRSSRGQFRRRQTASKASTFAEAFSSILWAGATCLAAAGSAFSLLFAGLALTVLWFAWSISPSRV